MEFEAEVLAGLAAFAEEELAAVGAVVGQATDTAVRFEYRGRVRHLLELRTAVAVYVLDVFAIPRPKALLGEEHIGVIARRIEQVRTLGSFSSFRFSAAGRDSPVFARLATVIEQRTGLDFDPDEGDLVLRIRPAAAGRWEVLYRLSPRPLSARAWRVRDRRGALNATIAAAMVAMTRPRPADRFLNLACGTGTLLVERAASGPTRRLLGIDIDAVVIRDADANGATGLVRGDAAAMPFRARSFDVLVADLPYGTTMGSPASNERLYPGVLTDAARVATKDARLVVITHDLQRFERVLGELRTWETADQIQVFQKGHNPKIWLLKRA